MKKLRPKIWKQTNDLKYYLSWKKKSRPSSDSESVIVKTEGGDWITFSSLGDNKPIIINRFGTKAYNIFLAKKYMREHQYQTDLRW